MSSPIERPDFIPEDTSVSQCRSLVDRLKDNLTYEQAILVRIMNLDGPGQDEGLNAQAIRVAALDRMIADASQWLGHIWRLQRAEETIAPPSFAGFEIGDRVRLPWKGVDANVVGFYPTFEPTHLECKDDSGRDHAVLPREAKLYPRD